MHNTLSIITKDGTLDSIAQALYPYSEEVDPKNGKFYWYEVGGRFSFRLKLKDGSFADSALIKEVDWNYYQDKTSSRYLNSIAWWEIHIEGRKITPEEEKIAKLGRESVYSKEYFLQSFENKEKYASYCLNFMTSSFVNSNGVWFEAIGVEDFYDTFIAGLDPEDRITIIDYHY
jgi:hypothetical protein